MMSPSQLCKYDLWLFDCDGVILQSNAIKSAVMYQVALHFSNEQIAKEFQLYHQEYAGKTRFVKLDYLFKGLLKQTAYQQQYQQALTMFGELCVKQLINCQATKGALSFINSLPSTHDKFIVSAATEVELHTVFKEKNIDKHFTGIYGGPRNRAEIFSDILSRYPNAKPLYFGDAKADHMVAKKFNVDFVFVADDSEFIGWKTYFSAHPEVTLINNFTELLT